MARTHGTKDLKLDLESFALLVLVQENEGDVYPIQTLRRLVRRAAEGLGYKKGAAEKRKDGKE